MKEREMRSLRGELQMVFQNSLSALNPRLRIGEILEEILKIHGVTEKAKRKEQVLAMLEKVGLSEEHFFRFPHELSGGQVQRLGIAGALLTHPKLIVCDEPVSALDVSIQAQILNLLMDLQDEMNLTYMFVTHDLSVVKHISNHIMVMYLGQCLELSTSDELFKRPLHPYTQALLSAIPEPDISMRNKEIKVIQGEVVSPVDPKPGCRFAARCEFCTELCTKDDPPLLEVSPGHHVACHLLAPK